MKRLIIILIAIILVLSAGLYVVFERYKATKEDATIWHQNTTALSTDIANYIVKDSLNAVNIQGLNLEINDLKQLNKRLYSDISVLKSKNKNLSSIIESTHTTLGTNTDTIFVPHYVDTIGNRIATLQYSDKWFSLDTKIEIGNSVIVKPLDLHYQYTDTLRLATSIKYKRFWYTFWKKTPIGVEIDAYSTNPNSKINSITYINLK